MAYKDVRPAPLRPFSSSPAHNRIAEHEWRDGHKDTHGYSSKEEALKDKHTNTTVKVEELKKKG